MAQERFEAVSQALDLIRTPLALEVLDDLAEGRSPYNRPVDAAVITAAMDVLRSIGAAGPTPSSSDSAKAIVTITPAGRVLYHRLVEIEHMAEQQAIDNDQAA